MQKQKVTVWPDGRINSTHLGEIDPALASQDMGYDRSRHAAFASTVSIEEIGNTLVVVKETSTVHIYTWIP